MTLSLKVGDRVRIKTENPGGSNRTPFFVRGKKGMIVFDHGPAGNPRDLGYGGSGEPALPLYGVSFHMAHLYDEDPDLVHDRVIVDVWGDWVEPATPERDAVQPIDLKEHEQSYYEKRVIAVQNLLVQKGIMNIDESRRLAAEFDFQKHGSPHPMVSPP